MKSPSIGVGEDALSGNFLKLSRNLLSHELWNEHRVFSKAEAWIDILFTVQYGEEPYPVTFGYKTIICYRGQALKSIETWAKRWNWSKSKVVRFFGMLKKRNMIRTETETQTTRLIVCNYEDYNKSRNANGTETETQTKRTRNASETHSETVEEGKKGKKVNKKKGTAPQKEAEAFIRDCGKVWNERIGNFQKDKATRYLKRVFYQLGPERGLAAWRQYVFSLKPHEFVYASAAKFSETIKQWDIHNSDDTQYENIWAGLDFITPEPEALPLPPVPKPIFSEEE